MEERGVDILEELKLAELKKESLHRSFNLVHEQANSVLLFTLQWKDLEQHLDLTIKSLRKQTHEVDRAKELLEQRAREIESKGAELGLVQRKIEESNGVLAAREKESGLLLGKIEECNGELEVKEIQLGLVQKRIEECNGEIEVKEKQLGLVKKIIEECNVEIVSKEKQLGFVQTRVEECACELQSKESELNLVRKSVEDWSEKLNLKREAVNLVQEAIENCGGELKLLKSHRSSIKDCNEQLELKYKELNEIQSLIEEREKEYELKKMQIASLKELIEEYEEELEAKEKLYDSIKKSVEDFDRECKSKYKELESTKASIEKHLAELYSEEKRLEELVVCHQEELEIKEEKLDSLKQTVIFFSKDLELKEREFCGIQMCIEKHNQELAMKEEKLSLVQKSIEECSKKFEVKKEQFNSIEKSILKCSEELEIKQKQLYLMQNSVKELSEESESEELQLDLIKSLKSVCLKELKEKEKQLRLVEKSVEECSKEFEVKKEQFNSIEKSIVKSSEECELKQKQLHLMHNSVKVLFEEGESKELQLDLIKRMTSACLEELKEKEKQFNLVKECLEKRLRDLEMKEIQFEERVKEFELKERQFDSVHRVVEDDNKRVELKEKQLTDILSSHGKPDLAANEAIGPISPSLPLRNGRNLQLLLNEHLKKHDLICGEICTTLKTANEPAKLVLDAMQGFYPPCSKDGDMGFDVSIIRKSCILLLEQLLIVSPKINPEVKDEARKLAGEWKAKMRVTAENSLEVLGFLELLAAFGLTSAFDGNELQCLFDVVAQHRQTPRLRQVLGVADKVFVTQLVPSQVKLEQTEDPSVNNALDSLSASLQCSNMAEGRSLQLFLNEHLDMPHLRQDEVLAAFHMSLDPAKFVLDLIQGSYSIVWKKQHTSYEGVIRNYILLLEQLKKVSPEISPQVKSEAMKLAVEWKTQMGSVNENSLEVFGFLQLLATYKLVTYFNKEEILGLLKTIAEHEQAPEICQALGFTDMVLGFVRNLIQKKQYIEAIRCICAFKLMDKAPPEAILKEYLANINRTAFDISKDRMNSPDAKDKATDFQLTALRALVECIVDCRLDYLLLYEDTKKSILQLEKQRADGTRSGTVTRADWGCSVPIARPMIQPQLQGKRNENVGAYASTNQPAPGIMLEPQLGGTSHTPGTSSLRDQLAVQNHYKRPRIDSPVVRSYKSQFPAPNNLYMRSSAGRYGPGEATNRRQT